MCACVLAVLLLAGPAGGAAVERRGAKPAAGERGFAVRQLPLPPAARLEADQQTVLVRPRRGGVDAVRAIAADRGVRAGRVVGRTGFVVVHTGRGAARAVLAALRRDARVAEAEPNYVRRAFAAPNDILLQKGDQQYYVPITRLTQAWDLAQGAPSVTIAVLDTGIDLDHPELASRVVGGWDFVGDDGEPADDSWHGTMVAGVAAATPNNGLGIAGSAWNASVMPVKVLDAEGQGTDADVAAGIVWAADHGADVLNLSLGGPGDSTVLRDAIDYALARDVVVVAASGNEASSRPQYPAAYPGVLAVGATDWSGNVTGFSSYGSWLDLVAPGFAIASTYLAPGPEPAFASASGTSFAAPLVAGVAALVRAQRPASSQTQVADELRRTARDAGPRGIDDSYGHGIVDAYAAVGGPAAPPFRAPPGDPKEPNGTPDRAAALTDPYYEWATISPQGDVDWFSKDVSAAGWLRFRVESEIYSGNPEAEMTPTLQAFGPDLRPLADPQPASTTRQEVTLPVRAAGRYYLRVTNRAGSRSPELNAGRPWGYTIKTEMTGDPPPGRWDFQRIAIESADYSNAPEGTAVADVTGDGRNDVLLTTSNDRQLRMYEQRTDGYLEQPLLRPTVGGRNSGLGVDTGDLDGDGKLDVAVAGWNVRVYRQVNGTLAEGSVVSDVAGAMQLRIGDFDGDGRRDIVVAWGDCTSARGLALLRNTASGWVRSDTPTPELEHELEVGDVNGDGRLDVVGLSGNCTSGGVIDVFRQNADGTFAREAIVPPYEGRDMDGIEVADVTADGRADIVVSRTAEMRVYAQQADGTLAAPTILAADGAGAVESGDVNGDGRRDIVGEGGIFLRQANGSWVKESGVGHSYYFDPNLLSLGDVNGDGKLDAAVADSSWPGFLNLYRQSSVVWPPPVWVRDTSPADFSEGASSSVAPTMTFGRSLNAASVTSSTVRLENASTGTAVAATPSYDSAARRVSLRPSAPLAPGPYLVRVGGVVDTSETTMPEQSFRFTVGTTADTTPPETYVTAGPWGGYIDEIGWDFMASEPGARFECHWGASWQRCNSPNLFAIVPPGAYVDRFRAIDAAGNVDSTPVVRSYTIPPTNDAFAAAVAISGTSGSVTSTNTRGSTEPGEPAHAGIGGGMSVWYRWVAPSTGRVVFDTTGSTFDTVLAVYTGSSVDALSEIASNDQAYGTNWSKLSFVATAGVVYRVAVAGYPYPRVARGTFTLSWAPPMAGDPDTVPPNVRLTAPADGARVAGDTPLRAEAGDDAGIERVEFFVDRDLVGSDAIAPYEISWDTRSYPGTTYAIEARAVDTSGNMTWSLPRTVYVDNSTPDTFIASGPSGNTTARDATFTFYSSASSSRFECTLDDSPWSACSSPATFTGLVDGSHTFSVRAINAAGTVDPSPATRTWTIGPPPPAPANDLFVNATGISAAYGSVTATTVGATREPGEPYHYASTGSASIWFRWTPAGSGTAVFDTIGSGFDTILAAYSGSSLASLTRLASDDDGAGNHASRISFAVTAGTTYHIAVDGYGTATGAVTLSWNAPAPPDTMPPTVALTAPADGAIVRGTIEVSADASDDRAVARVEFLANGTLIGVDNAAPYTVSLASAAVTDGAVTLAARALDDAGNAATDTRTVDVDNTPPETTIDAGPSGTVTDNIATFFFSASEAGGFECSLDAAAFAACEAPTTYAGVGDGVHSFHVRAVDGAGNRDASPATRSWTVDTTPPETTIDSGPPPSTDSTSATLTFSASEDASFECALDAAPFAACTSPRSYSSLREGEHRFRVRARDGAGNLDVSPASRTWTVLTLPPPPPPPPPPDVTPPETSIVAGPAARTAATTADFAFSASELDSTFECSLDSAAFVACTSPRELSGLADGEHLFEVRARDAADNVDATPAARTWTVDTQPPETLLDEAPAGPVASAAARFRFSSEPGAAFDCSLDDAPFTPCVSPLDRHDLADGPHAFTARARDDLGNVDPTPARAEWAVDTRPPETTIGGAPPERTESTSAHFTFAADEASAFDCSLDGSPFAACSSPVDHHDLGVGLHTFRVRSRDSAGNVDETPASRAWTILSPTPPAPPTQPQPPPLPAPSPPGPSPPAAGERAARGTIIPGTVFVDARGIARVPLSCEGPRASVCRGRISLVYVRARASAARKRSPLTLGARSFAITAARRVAPTVPLAARGRRLLARHGTLRIRVIVAWRDAGRTRTTSLTTNLKPLSRR